MAAALVRLVDDAGLRQRLREGVVRMAHEWFSWERVIERTLATFPPQRTAEFAQLNVTERDAICLNERH